MQTQQIKYQNDPSGKGCFSRIGRAQRPHSAEKHYCQEVEQLKKKPKAKKKYLTLQEKLTVINMFDESDSDNESKKNNLENQKQKEKSSKKEKDNDPKHKKSQKKIENPSNNNKKVLVTSTGLVACREHNFMISDKLHKAYKDMCPFERKETRKGLIQDENELGYFKVPDIGKYEAKKLRSGSVLVGDILKNYNQRLENQQQIKERKEQNEKNRLRSFKSGIVKESVSTRNKDLKSTLNTRCFVNMGKTPDREYIQKKQAKTGLSDKRYAKEQNLNPKNWSKNKHNPVINISVSQVRDSRPKKYNAPENFTDINYDFVKKRKGMVSIVFRKPNEQKITSKVQKNVDLKQLSKTFSCPNSPKKMRHQVSGNTSYIMDDMTTQRPTTSNTTHRPFTSNSQRPGTSNTTVQKRPNTSMTQRQRTPNTNKRLNTCNTYRPNSSNIQYRRPSFANNFEKSGLTIQPFSFTPSVIYLKNYIIQNINGNLLQQQNFGSPNSFNCTPKQFKPYISQKNWMVVNNQKAQNHLLNNYIVPPENKEDINNTNNNNYDGNPLEYMQILAQSAYQSPLDF